MAKLQGMRAIFFDVADFGYIVFLFFYKQAEATHSHPFISILPHAIVVANQDAAYHHGEPFG